MPASGSPRKLTVDGLSSFIDRDCNARLPSGRFENEARPHSGGNQKKMLLGSGAISNITIKADKDEYERWQALNDDPRENMSLLFQDRGGNIFRAVGWVELEGMDDADNLATLRLVPANGVWTLFAP
jgi:hypothetical protein